MSTNEIQFAKIEKRTSQIAVSRNAIGGRHTNFEILFLPVANWRIDNTLRHHESTGGWLRYSEAILHSFDSLLSAVSKIASLKSSTVIRNHFFYLITPRMCLFSQAAAQSCSMVAVGEGKYISFTNRNLQ